MIEIANRVVAVFLNSHKNLLMLVERTQDGIWTLPGGDVDPGEDEMRALERHMRSFGFIGTTTEQLGPMERGTDGNTSKAFLFELEFMPDDVSGPYAQYNLFTEDDVRTGVITTDGPPVQCAIWDGFSVMRPARVTASEEDGRGLTGIFCPKGQEHLLVKDDGTNRRTWGRLDPQKSSGYMEPQS